MIIYNPLDTFYKSQTGAVCENQTITFRVKFFDSVVFVYIKDVSNVENRVEMTNKGDFCECEVSFSRGLYWYEFELKNSLFIGENDNLFGEVTDKPKSFQLSVFDKDYSVPDFLNGGLIYQIFPDRFYCSNENLINNGERKIHSNKNDIPEFLPNSEGQVLNNDFFGGDIKGIIQKLEYLSTLNVTALYLNPIFKAYSNHRYDTGDYMTIDSLLGTENDLKELIEKANDFGIKIILDGVFNHTGDDSIYFNKYGNYNSVGAYQSKDSPYFDWYYFIEFPQDYESWWGIKTLPSVNEQSKGFIDYITGENGVLSHYTKLGIGGWRLDVVDELPKDFVQKIREAVKKENKNAIIIGEVWEDASNKISYGVRREYFLGKELDSVMNYPLKDAIIGFVKTGNENSLSKLVKTQIDHYPSFVLNTLMNLLSTHDTARLLSIVSDYDCNYKSKQELSTVKLGENEKRIAVNRLKIASLLQYTLYGTPSLYYGDEIGMEGYCDPLNRRYFAWDNVDKEINEWYIKLGEMRAMYSAFSGSFVEKYAKNGAYVFERRDGNSNVLVAVNCGNREVELKYNGQLLDVLSQNVYDNKIRLCPNEFGVFVSK